jgi:small subunit ribosomal protein S6
MVRPYEVVYIFDSTLEEPAINERLERFHALVKSEGADAPRLSHWGKRTLAYPIKKREMGYYVVANFQAETGALPEFERAIKLDEGVLRFLVVADDKDYASSRAPGDRKFEEDEE